MLTLSFCFYSSPLATFEFMISSALVLDGNEKLALTVGYTHAEHASAPTVKACNATFIYDTCFLEAGIGEYEVTIDDDKILMTSLGSPRLVALANNTQVDYSYDKGGYHPSTLAGVAEMLWEKYESWVADYKPKDGATLSYSTLR